jgi:hypothetical protein
MGKGRAVPGTEIPVRIVSTERSRLEQRYGMVFF